MDIKNNIIKYFKTNHLKLKNIKFDEIKGFVLETNKGTLTSSNLPLLNYISRNDMEFIKMELNDVSAIDYVSQYLLNHNIKILNISLNILDKKIMLHTTKGNLSNESFPELSFLTLDKLYSLYELCKIEDNTIQEIINNVVFNIKNNVEDVLSSYILHSIAYNLNKNNIKDFLIDIELNDELNDEIDSNIHTIIFDKLQKEINYQRELDKNLKDRLTGAFKSDFYHKFLGTNPLKREEDNHNDIIIFGSHLNYINCNAIMYCDLDNFKMINELINYTTGDLVLQNFTKSVYEFSNKLMVIRKGGDEFIILGNIILLDKLSYYMSTIAFIDKLNNNIYSLQNNPNQIKYIKLKNQNIDIKTTVSNGISKFNIDIDFNNKKSFLEFNKEFRKSLDESEKNLKLNKKEKDYFYRKLNN